MLFREKTEEAERSDREENDRQEDVEPTEAEEQPSGQDEGDAFGSQSGEDDSEDGPEIPSELPILPIRDAVIFPLTAVPVSVGQPRSIQLVDEVAVGDRVVGLVTARDQEVEEPGAEDLFQVGTAAVILRMLKVQDGSLRILVQGLERIRIQEFTQEKPYLKAKVETASDEVEDSVEVEALMRNTTDLFQRLVALVPQMPDELTVAAMNVDDPRQLVYLVASNVGLNRDEAQAILELDDVKEKLRKVNAALTRELEVLELGKKIQSQAESEMSKMQREYLLREQMKAIQKELGEEDEEAAEIRELEVKIEEAGMPEEAYEEAKRELSRLSKIPSAAAEHSVIRTYLEWLVAMPWQKVSEEDLDIDQARQILDEDHYDLEKVKERILEYLAVRRLRLERIEDQEEARKSDILCFVGPPGVGKTSLGQSIARALGRKFVRMSLGGMRDEAEIRGHRRTYIGAMPGRIIQAIRRVGTRDPVFMLDEVDKVGADFRGDPSSALLEVLDPRQNNEFRDHYLDVNFDLSQVMFITTANLLDPISPPLRDRMEILTLSGYTEEEKVKIAQNYLIPRQIEAAGLRAEEIEFEEGAISRIIREYTREAGVRNLEREIGSACRKVAVRVGEGEKEKVVIREGDVSDYLGKQKFFPEVAERISTPGVATGLAWTPTGGEVLFVEAAHMAGRKGLTLTGQLGDVMKESAQAGLSYVRANAERLGIADDFFRRSDIHIHVPAGSIPKDGPSAGVTMATALVSLLTDRAVRPDVAMTGEITLLGRVLPVGGIKEKVLAAARAGLKTVILPMRNEKDLDDLPDEIRKSLQFVMVDTVDDVLDVTLQDGADQGGS
jgi:ATP-dependent Lon protease